MDINALPNGGICDHGRSGKVKETHISWCFLE